MDIKVIENSFIMNFLLVSEPSYSQRSLHIKPIQMRLIKHRIVLQIINLAVLLKQE